MQQYRGYCQSVGRLAFDRRHKAMVMLKMFNWLTQTASVATSAPAADEQERVGVPARAAAATVGHAEKVRTPSEAVAEKVETSSEAAAARLAENQALAGAVAEKMETSSEAAAARHAGDQALAEASGREGGNIIRSSGSKACRESGIS